MRSCQQLLQGDAGEFFSPDYLCSNPPLWCNWTIRVEPGKRIHLHLEDLTSSDGCSLKEDQIHVEEPADGFRGHAVLQQCWREAKYTSSGNTLYVVLLIGGWPSPPYRGFHGRYQAFGPPVVFDPRQGSKADPPRRPVDFGDIVMEGERVESDVPEPRDGVYDYHGQATTAEAGLETEVRTDDRGPPNCLQRLRQLIPSSPLSGVKTNLLRWKSTATSTRPQPRPRCRRSRRGPLGPRGGPLRRLRRRPTERQPHRWACRRKPRVQRRSGLQKGRTGRRPRTGSPPPPPPPPPPKKNRGRGGA